MLFKILGGFVWYGVAEGGEWGSMEGHERELLLACVVSGTLFSVLSVASLCILWAVNWRPWRIYR